ncbi:unnamed protein product [Darwinula stevensoni]|uniref:Uncharacterized protein n=1 Tax=Darwinula stevensoni TaxID=69355 RepID=A0A7R9AIM1_9CRUS|nr:unnamed protein product [Darwinula stevensoni]CAG0906706.1 unnamed protein product [Darwinula stevensoni]
MRIVRKVVRGGGRGDDVEEREGGPIAAGREREEPGPGRAARRGRGTGPCARPGPSAQGAGDPPASKYRRSGQVRAFRASNRSSSRSLKRRSANRKERESLKSENLRCTHRISYLEEHIVELETAIRQRPSRPGHHYQNLQVFQRGGTVTKIPVSGTAGKKNSPSPGKAGQRSGSAERFETMSDCAGRVRRVSRCPSGPRGGTSDVDAAYLSDTARPLPPKKPERLSLYRATSVQSVEQGGSGSGSTRKRNHKGENRVMKTWPSVERSLGNGLATFKSKSEFKWPSLQGLRLRGGSGSSSSSSVALLHHNNKKTKEQWC